MFHNWYILFQHTPYIIINKEFRSDKGENWIILVVGIFLPTYVFFLMPWYVWQFAGKISDSESQQTNNNNTTNKWSLSITSTSSQPHSICNTISNTSPSSGSALLMHHAQKAFSHQQHHHQPLNHHHPFSSLLGAAAAAANPAYLLGATGHTTPTANHLF